MSDYESNEIEYPDQDDQNEENDESNNYNNYNRQEVNNNESYNNYGNDNSNYNDQISNKNADSTYNQNVNTNPQKNKTQKSNKNSIKKNSKINDRNNMYSQEQNNYGEKSKVGTIDENAENPEILYEEFFNYFLQHKKRTLNIKECKNAMRCLGLVVTEKEIQEFLDIPEKTGKEKINLEQFKAVCNHKFTESSNNINELEEAFALFDPENTGIIDANVLRHQMKVFKPKMTEEEVNQIISEFGEDNDEHINYREYLNNIKNQ